MNVRAALQKKPIAGISLAVFLVLVAAVLMAHSLRNSGAHEVNAEYFTVDDGKTWFAASNDNVAPFDHDGKTAVKVYLFQEGNGAPFVAYLERFTPEGKKKVEKLWANARAAAAKTGGRPEIDIMALSALTATATEVKKPGDNNQWYGIRKAPRSVMKIEPPSGGKLDDVYPVLP